MKTFTIGEVLNHLKDEFDDITISKIRFLESEGLIHPDRTDSGYRKFTEDDIERLRYVLRAQRDRYLPLKVIKEELDRLDAGLPVEVPAPPTPPGEPESEPQSVAADVPPSTAGGPVLEEPPAVQLTVAELTDATGLESGEIQALCDHGLLADDEPFDGDDLRIARSAARLMMLGLEPRHLRMYVQFADRETALYEQLVTPLLKQRNPDARTAASDQLEDLVSHGSRLHGTILARELRSLLRQ